jgi:hypothetical protein
MGFPDGRAGNPDNGRLSCDHVQVGLALVKLQESQSLHQSLLGSPCDLEISAETARKGLKC